MANFAYNVAAFELFKGTLDLQEAGDDIRVLLLESNSDVNVDDLTISAVLGRAGTTELTSANYARQALASQAVTQDDVNDRAEFDADDVTFAGLVQAAAETIVAYLVYKHVTNDTDSIPILHADISPAITPNGNFTIQWNAEGILQGASA